jgi:hypothetical protein
MELRAQICHAVLDEAVRGYDDNLREIDEDGGIRGADEILIDNR